MDAVAWLIALQIGSANQQTLGPFWVCVVWARVPGHLGWALFLAAPAVRKLQGQYNSCWQSFSEVSELQVITQTPELLHLCPELF